MTDAKRDLAADLLICEAATPGPWHYGSDDWRGNVQDRFWFVSGETDEDVEGRTTAVGVLRVERNPTSHPVCENNARFVAAAREGWPHAIRRAQAGEAAEARVAELEAEVADLRERYAAACDRIAAQSELLSRRAEGER